jgi:hypothetical protein
MRFFVVPILAPALLKGIGLMLLRQTGDEVGVACRDSLLDECLGHVGNELQERKTSVDVRWTLARFQHKRGHIVTRHVEQALESLRLFVWMDIDALRVFDLSLVLQKLSLTYTTMGYRTSWNLYL